MKTSIQSFALLVAAVLVSLSAGGANAQCALTPAEWHRINVLEGHAYAAIMDKHYRTGIRLARPMLKLSRRGCAKAPELSALGHLADSYFGLRQYKRALAYYEPALRLAKETDHIVDETFSLYRISLSYLKLHDGGRAQDFRNQLAAVIPRVESSERSYDRGYADIIRRYLDEIDAAMKRRSNTGAI
jgi:hypothetical protein